jgi:hypothetical protein
VSIYTARIRDAMSDAVDTGKLAEAWQALHPKEITKAIPAVLSQFLAAAARAITRALAAVLPDAWTEGWVLGQQSATAVLDGAPVDWAAWTPGDPRAAAQVAGTGLQQLLAEQHIRIKSIAQTRLSEIADVLERSIGSTEVHRPPLPAPLPPVYSTGDVARQLRDVLDKPENAELVAQTEIARAQSAAARQVYRETGRTEVEISTADDDRVCPACQAAEELGPHPVGQPPMVPLHPRCRCAELPVLAAAS